MSYLSFWQPWAREGDCGTEEKCPCAPKPERREGVLFEEAASHGPSTSFRETSVLQLGHMWSYSAMR